MLLFGAVLLVAACATEASDTRASQPAGPPQPDIFESTVLQRAGYDLQCNQRVGLIRLGANAIGAVGCGRRATYTCICLWHVWTDCTRAACVPDAIATAAPAPPPQSSELMPDAYPQASRPTSSR